MIVACFRGGHAVREALVGFNVPFFSSFADNGPARHRERSDRRYHAVSRLSENVGEELVPPKLLFSFSIAYGKSFQDQPQMAPLAASASCQEEYRGTLFGFYGDVLADGCIR